MNPARQKILDVAKAQLGETEHPSNSNITKFNLWFGKMSEAAKDVSAEWCGISISWIYAFAGYPLGVMDFFRGFASVPWAWNHWAKQAKNTHFPLPGDIVFFDWQKGTEKGGAPDHVGIFIKWIDHGEGTFETYEGNSSGSARAKKEGGEYEHRTDRTLQFVHGFVSPLNLPA